MSTSALTATHSRTNTCDLQHAMEFNNSRNLVRDQSQRTPLNAQAEGLVDFLLRHPLSAPLVLASLRRSIASRSSHKSRRSSCSLCRLIVTWAKSSAINVRMERIVAATISSKSVKPLADRQLGPR